MIEQFKSYAEARRAFDAAQTSAILRRCGPEGSSLFFVFAPADSAVGHHTRAIPEPTPRGRAL